MEQELETKKLNIARVAKREMNNKQKEYRSGGNEIPRPQHNGISITKLCFDAKSRKDKTDI